MNTELNTERGRDKKHVYKISIKLFGIKTFEKKINKTLFCQEILCYLIKSNIK